MNTADDVTADDVRAHARAMVAEIETNRDPTGCELRAAKLIDRLEARLAELELADKSWANYFEDASQRAEAAEQRVRELEERVRELEGALQELAALAQREIEKNPALGIPHYRKGALARRALELAGGPLDKRHYDLVMRVWELEQALREIAAMDGATYYDDPVAGYAAVARRALGLG